MYMLLDRFMRETDYKNPDVRIREYMDGRITEYKEQRETIKDSLAKIRPSDSLRTATSGSRNPTGTGPTSPSGAGSPLSEDDDTVPLHTLEKLYEVDRQTDDNTKDTNAEKANLSYLQGVQVYNEGRYEEALAKFDEAVRLEPGVAEYHRSRGVTLHAMGRYEEALASVDRSIELQPNAADGHRLRAEVLHAMGRHEEAQEEERVARKLDSGDASSKD
jgi:tetratricopeptide (TPR) repeat protein